MSRLIEDLLQLSRISRAEIHLTRVDLSQMVRDINAELAEAQPDRDVTTYIPFYRVIYKPSLRWIVLSLSRDMIDIKQQARDRAEYVTC